MRGAALLFALLLSSLPASAQTTAPPPNQTPVPVYGFEVVRVYPHDPSAFTQGLVFRDG
jgi:glutamine cyclotransferase